MKYLSDFDRISGRAVIVSGVKIRQPKLEEVRLVGSETFYSYLSVINADAGKLIKTIFGDGVGEEIPPEITTYDFFMLSDKLAPTLIEALQFFVDGELHYSEKHGAILFLSNGNAGELAVKFDADIFARVKATIDEICGFEVDDDLKKTHMQNEKKCLEIISKLEAGREKMRKSKGKTDESNGMELWNIIGAVAAKSPSYNLSNIWNLTLCQLYDQFSRCNNDFYLGMAATRWCVWGEDSFDHEPWFKLPDTK